MEERVIEVKKGIRLDQLLKYAGIYPTGGEAKRAIQTGKVAVNGAVKDQRGYRLEEGDVVEIREVGVALRIKMIE